VAGARWISDSVDRPPFEAAGIYDVRPAQHIREHSPLDRQVEISTVAAEPIETILTG
jgi:hypothetical protein